MVFWILVVMLAIIVVAVVWTNVEYDGFFVSLGWGIIAALLGSIAGIVIMLLASLVVTPTPQTAGETEYELTALQTSSSVSGQFFLGSGYVDGKRTLNYITNDDGAYRMESADAAQSVVYQDAETPTVTVHEWDWKNDWLSPFVLRHGHTYTFHIPEGSILSDYTINNQ